MASFASAGKSVCVIARCKGYETNSNLLCNLIKEKIYLKYKASPLVQLLSLFSKLSATGSDTFFFTI